MTLALLLALTAADAVAAAPHPLSYAARASKAEVRLGEPFDYEVEVRHRPEERYALPQALELAPFRAEGGACRRTERGGEVTTTCALRLALFALGPNDVPDLPLAAETPEGRAVLAVPGPRVTGVGVLDPDARADALQLRDIAPPVPVWIRSWRLVWWALGVAAAAVLAVALWRALRRRSEAEPAAPPMPADERFARRLDALEAERLSERGLGREHAFRLSEIVREYLGAITGVNALDLTTEELLAQIALVGDPRIDGAGLRAFLERADLVKFARAEAGVRECGEGMGFARGVLEATRTSTTTTTTTKSTTP